MAVRHIELNEEMPPFSESVAIPSRKYPEGQMTTSFARHEDVIGEFGRRAAEFKEKLKDGVLVVNVVGPGMVSSKSDGKEKVFSFEAFELWNKLKEIGIAPDKVKMYVIDRNQKVLDTVKNTEFLEVPRDAKPEYTRSFFPESQVENNESYIVVKIPEECRESMICLPAFDITKQHAPEQAHITFSLIQEAPTKEYAETLMKSTMKGGYVMPYMDLVEFAREVGLEQVDAPKCSTPVYIVK